MTIVDDVLVHLNFVFAIAHIQLYHLWKRHMNAKNNMRLLFRHWVFTTTDIIYFRLQKLGALEWEKIVHGHQAWRLITGIWLHAGVIHLLANMLSLVFIGIRLEQQFGFSTSSVLLWPALYFGNFMLTGCFFDVITQFGSGYSTCFRD